MKLNEIATMSTRPTLSQDEASMLYAAKQLPTTDWTEIVDGMFDKLYDIFVNSDMMPYGTAKAREGDPVDFISQKLESMSTLEFKRFLRANTSTE